MTELRVFTSPAAAGVHYNLAPLAGAAARTGPGQTVADRHPSGVDVTVADGPAHIRDVEPATVTGWCDGIQNSAVVAWRDGRPVTAAYLAAGAADGNRPAALLGLAEHIGLYAADGDPVAAELSAASGVPVTHLDVTDRTHLAHAATRRIGDDRDRLERRLVTGLLGADPDTTWAVDGSLAHMPATGRLIGVVKTHSVRYLPAEDELFTLPAGWRSSIFTFTHRRRAEDDEEGVTVWSTYVRVRHLPAAAWDAGLLRLETCHPDQIDAAASLLCSKVQPAAAAAVDGRWDRQLDPVAWCEKLLRNRRPLLFAHL